MNKDDLLKRAADHIFSTGLGDGASCLCRENMCFGLAKIHCLQEYYGLEPNATFISTPDETISKNVPRWRSGFGYGGKLTWGSGDNKLIILDVKPNACGMLVGGLSYMPDIEELIQSITSIGDIYVDNVQLDWDCNKGNHFINIFKVTEKSPDLSLPTYVFIIHGSVSELKGETEKGPGLYFDKSQFLQDTCEIVKTELGNLHVLLDSDAEDYYRFFRYAERFAIEKRKTIAYEIFGCFKEISNITHQGMQDYNNIHLGCYDTKNAGSKVFPITLRADLPAFLMKGLDNLRIDIIDRLGFRKRAENFGVTEMLLKANILPHGGGYSFHNFTRVKRVLEINTKRYFAMSMKNSNGTFIFSNPQDLEFDYRGDSVIKNSIDLGLGEKIGKLDPFYAIKI